MEENKENFNNEDLQSSMFSSSADDLSSMFSSSAEDIENSSSMFSENIESIETVENSSSMFDVESQEEVKEGQPLDTTENDVLTEEDVEKESEETSEEIVDNDVEQVVEENIQETTKEVQSNKEEQFSQENNDLKKLITVRPVKFEEFPQEYVKRAIKKNLDILQDISMHISVEIGRTKSSIKEVMGYKEGSIVELNKIAGEQVEIYANGKLVARGEVIVIEDKFGVRVTTTNLPRQEVQ